MFGIDLSAISCAFRKNIFLQIVCIILTILFKLRFFNDSYSRAFGETLALSFLAFVLWAASNRITAWYDCGAIITTSCDKILKSAKDNKCTLADLPSVVYL